MTVKECYEQMGSDYEGVLGRLGSEAIVKRFALKFLQDPSFAQLKESLAKNDGEEAFRAAHTLKGVCLNLGFDELFEVSAELTEKLRERKTAGSEELFLKSVYLIATRDLRISGCNFFYLKIKGLCDFLRKRF